MNRFSNLSYQELVSADPLSIKHTRLQLQIQLFILLWLNGLHLPVVASLQSCNCLFFTSLITLCQVCCEQAGYNLKSFLFFFLSTGGGETFSPDKFLVHFPERHGTTFQSRAGFGCTDTSDQLRPKIKAAFLCNDIWC